MHVQLQDDIVDHEHNQSLSDTSVWNPGERNEQAK